MEHLQVAWRPAMACLLLLAPHRLLSAWCQFPTALATRRSRCCYHMVMLMLSIDLSATA